MKRSIIGVALGVFVGLLIAITSATGGGRISPQGGTVTGVTAGSGLQGGGSGGPVVLSANELYLQRRVSSTCLPGTAITAIGVDGSVTCGSAGTGDIEGVTAGSGMSGGGTSGTVSVYIDPTYTQRRVSASCGSGSSIRAIAEDGTVTCETDDNAGGDITDVVAGAGLTGGGATGSVTLDVVGANGITAFANTVEIDSTYTQRRVSGSCAAGSSIRVIDSAGGVTCETDDVGGGGGITNSAGNNVVMKSDGTNAVASTITDSGTLVEITNHIHTTPGKQIHFEGTNLGSLFNYATGATEDVYLRGGKTASDVYIGDANTGGVHIGSATNATDIGGTLAVAGNTTLGDAAADVVDINGDVLKVGSAVDGQFFSKNESIGFQWGSSSSQTGFINYYSDFGTVNNYRSLDIRDGKGTQIALFDGPTRAVTLTGALSVAGVLTASSDSAIGDNIADTHTFTGITKFGVGPWIRSDEGSINFGYNDASTATGYINYKSNGGFGASRNLIVADGQGATIVNFTGLTKLAAFAGAVTVAGSAQLGDSATVDDVDIYADVSVYGLTYDQSEITAAPSFTSCGTSPAFETGSGASAGRFTTGSGTLTNCTINFGRTYTTGAPSCVFTAVNANLWAAISAQTTSSVTLCGVSAASNCGIASITSTTWNYQCSGF